jgi:hypothetical protein
MADSPEVAEAIAEALAAPKNLEKQRNEEAKCCHESWNNIHMMKGHAHKVYELYHDYLGIMYAMKKSPFSIPHQLIDLQKHKKMLMFTATILYFKVKIITTWEKFDDQIKAGEECMQAAH